MSQQKVDKYKEEKANRKKNMKKERVMTVVRRCVLSVVAIALVAWIGYSAYDSYTSNQEREVASVNYDSINEYMSSMYSSGE